MPVNREYAAKGGMARGQEARRRTEPPRVPLPSGSSPGGPATLRPELLPPAQPHAVRAEVLTGAPPAVPAAGGHEIPPRRQPPRSVPPGDGGLPALPRASRVLAVTARPGQEAADLGAILAAYHVRGAQLSVLCLTRGEASELNSTCERLEAVRPWELQVAAGLLGVSSVTVADYPDGRLGCVPVTTLTEHVLRSARHDGADLLLVIDPVTADSDTAAVAGAACLAAQQQGLPVLARTVPGPGRRWRAGLGADTEAVRARQALAADAHSSQRAAPPAGAGGPDAVPGSGEGWELVRWLVAPSSAPSEPLAGTAVGSSA